MKTLFMAMLFIGASSVANACDRDGDRFPCAPPAPVPAVSDQSYEDADLDDGRTIEEPPTPSEPAPDNGRDGPGDTDQ